MYKKTQTKQRSCGTNASQDYWVVIDKSGTLEACLLWRGSIQTDSTEHQIVLSRPTFDAESERVASCMTEQRPACVPEAELCLWKENMPSNLLHLHSKMQTFP